MKNVFNLLFVFTICALSACNGTHEFIVPVENIEGSVQVKFYNETGYNITDLNVGENNIGYLSKSGQTDYIVFEQFLFDSGIPSEACFGHINGVEFDSFSDFYWCGTGKYFEEEGMFEMSVEITEYNGKSYFLLTMKSVN